MLKKDTFKTSQSKKMAEQWNKALYQNMKEDYINTSNKRAKWSTPSLVNKSTKPSAERKIFLNSTHIEDDRFLISLKKKWNFHGSVLEDVA